MKINNKELFEQIKTGNKQSFELLFRTYYAPMCLLAQKYLRDKDECEDVVQKVFVKIWEKRKSININSSASNYLFTAVRNQCINHIQHQKIKQQHQNYTLNNYQNENINEIDFPEPGLMSKIEKSIEALPPRRREIFRLSREEGLKYHEIADKLGLSVKTIETHLGLALKSLRESLKEYRKLIISIFSVWPKGK